jgi:hypothetical protein
VFLWRRHAVETFRQETFAVRDALFDLASQDPDSEISLDSAAYREFRKELNSLIRFAHHISYVRAVVFNVSRWLFLPEIPTNRIIRRSMVSILDIEDEEIREQVKAMVRRLNWNIVMLCMKTSPILLVYGAIVIARLATPIWWHSFRARQIARSQHNGAAFVPAAGIRVHPTTQVRKVTAQRMHRTHEAVWIESRESSEVGELAACR